jgi:hypothetical protein
LCIYDGLKDEEDETFAALATVFYREKLDVQKKEDNTGKTIAYCYQPILTRLSVMDVIRRCFMATPINPELSGVFQYQLENIQCVNVTHTSTGF